MGYLAPGELKRFGLYFEGILNRKQLVSYSYNDISCRGARGFGDMFPEKILKWLMQSVVFLCIILIRLSFKKYYLLEKISITATFLLWVILVPEKFLKTCSS